MNIRLQFVITLCFLISACDSDPFGIGRAKIIDPYELEQSEVKPYYYYLVGGIDTGAYGSIDSTVGKIGWNERYILLWQTDAGMRAAWRIIDSESLEVSGYLTEEMARFDPRVAGVSVVSVDEAWKVLK